MRRLIIAVSIIALLALPASVLAAKKQRTAALAAASITVTVEGNFGTFTWTGADGGWLYVNDACRDLFVSSGAGDGSFTDYLPCHGPATARLLSVTSGTNPDDTARLDVLAEASYTP